jgi:hypothetical protein
MIRNVEMVRSKRRKLLYDDKVKRSRRLKSSGILRYIDKRIQINIGNLSIYQHMETYVSNTDWD